MRFVALENDEVLRLLRAARQHGPRAHAMVLLAIRHGPRVSEVTGLLLEHVNMREGWVRVERLKGSLTTVQTLERHPGQPLLDEMRVINRWLRARRDDGGGVLFLSTHGGQMNRSTFAGSGGAWPRRPACRRSSGTRTSPSTRPGRCSPVRARVLSSSVSTSATGRSARPRSTAQSATGTRARLPGPHSSVCFEPKRTNTSGPAPPSFTNCAGFLGP